MLEPTALQVTDHGVKSQTLSGTLLAAYTRKASVSEKHKAQRMHDVFDPS